MRRKFLISFDPNLREPLWESKEQAKEAIWYGIRECDVLKIANNEIKWLSGKADYDEGVHLERMLSFANEAASIVTTRKGAIRSMPDREEVDALLCVGKYVIGAKLIMGIFSLELSKPLWLEIEDWKEEYGAVIEKYLHQ